MDFTELNKAYPKHPYPLPNIDRWLDDACGFRILSFMDGYLAYNQVRMSHNDNKKMTFKANRNNVYYKVMPFRLKNAWATYQRLMKYVFIKQIGHNLKVYINNMFIEIP